MLIVVLCPTGNSKIKTCLVEAVYLDIILSVAVEYGIYVFTAVVELAVEDLENRSFYHVFVPEVFVSVEKTFREVFSVFCLYIFGFIEIVAAVILDRSAACFELFFSPVYLRRHSSQS